MKRIILLITAVMTVLLLASCDILNIQNPPEQEKHESLVYDSDSEFSIVFGEGVTEEDAIVYGEDADLALVESTLLGNHIARILELSEGEEAQVTLEYFENEGRCNIYLDGEYVFVFLIMAFEFYS